MSRPIRTVLIANRGEIAVRIARTLRRLGLRSVVVHHAADAASPAVREADEAVEITGPTPVAAYLDAAGVVEAARRAGADAVHPGYGFLSENARFAQAVIDAGLRFVGPKPEVMRLMGDKLRARELVQREGFPVAPSATEGDDRAAFRAAVGAIGLPVLVKAAAGGGGRGMRIVREAGALDAELAAARGEAERAFGDGRVYVERYVERPRHVEVQILSDSRGGHVHLGERECSVQRRFQKIVEESPSPALTDEERRRLCEIAAGIARTVGYESAGTVEFLFTPEREIYFLEMNTRLQVEHPVTEARTGLDLVAEQIRVADGEALGFRQEDVRFEGHAIEGRLCAEDPENGYVPTIGEVLVLRPPSGAGVRFDGGLRAGQPITTAFDSMLAKVIAHGADRAEAIRRLRGALRDLVLLGVVHNGPHLERILAHPAFEAGDVHTHFLEERRAELALPPAEGAVLETVLAAAAAADRHQAIEVPEPWASLGRWRN